MLSADILLKCPCCSAATEPSDDTCAACRCDLSIERQVFARLAPSIRELRLVFGVVLVVNAIITYLAHEQLVREGLPATTLAATGAAVCAVMGALWLAAPRAPLATAVIGLAIFGGKWIYDATQDAAGVLHLGPGLAVRALIVLAFVYAIRAGLVARRLRARRASPPTALTTATPSA